MPLSASRRRVHRFYLYQACSSFAIWIPFWALWMRQHVGSDFEFTLADVAFWVGLLIFQLPVGVLADRLGRKWTIVLAETFRTAGILGYGLGTSLLGYVAANLIWSLGGAFSIGTSAYLYETLMEDHQETEFPRYIGRNTFIQIGSNAAAALVGGIVVALAGTAPGSYQVTLVLGAAVNVAAVAVAATFVEPAVDRVTEPTALKQLRQGFRIVRRREGVALLIGLQVFLGVSLYLMTAFRSPYLAVLGIAPGDIGAWVAGFLPLAAGRIRIDGEDCAGRPPEDRGLGYVPQGYALLPHRTVLQNVRYAADLRGARDAEDRAWAMLHRFRLEPLARAYPAQLSGGERQRVAMARALAAEPRLLLWDEPLAALDAQAQGELLDLPPGVLEDERLPLLLVTHAPGTAFSLAHRCLVLDGGREAFFGPLEDLLVRPPTPFVARFLGIENVYLRADLEASPSACARGLGGRAGRQVICVPAERVGWSWDPGEGWKGSLVRVRRTPRGTELWADLDGVRLRATRPGDVTDGKAPARGADGDMIRLAAAAGPISLDVPGEETARRRAAWAPPAPSHLRGWPALYREHVLQAPQGCDLDFLRAPTAAHRRFVEPVVGRS